MVVVVEVVPAGRWEKQVEGRKKKEKVWFGGVCCFLCSFVEICW